VNGVEERLELSLLWTSRGTRGQPRNYAGDVTHLCQLSYEEDLTGEGGVMYILLAQDHVSWLKLSVATIQHQPLKSISSTLELPKSSAVVSLSSKP
jgi:hypothetical protein